MSQTTDEKTRLAKIVQELWVHLAHIGETDMTDMNDPSDDLGRRLRKFWQMLMQSVVGRHRHMPIDTLLTTTWHAMINDRRFDMSWYSGSDYNAFMIETDVWRSSHLSRTNFKPYVIEPPTDMAAFENDYLFVFLAMENANEF